MRFFTSLSGQFIAAIALCVATAATASAQECGKDQLTTWWPRAYLTASNDPISAADRTAIEAQLLAVEALMRKTPYAAPRGFAVKPTFAYHDVTSRTRLYPYEFSLMVYLRCSKYDEHGADISLTFNPDPQKWSEGDRPALDERGDALYTERVRTETLFGATATYGRFHAVNTEGLFVLFTTGGESPTLPVTREEYLRFRIFTHEGKDQEKLNALAADLSKTPYQRWLEDAPARKKRNEELFALISRTNPAQAAKMRADMEKAEQAEAEKLKRNDAYERGAQAKNMEVYRAIGDKLRAEIAAMSPQERSSPALLVGGTLVRAGTPNAYAIVRKNPAFYRAAGSPFVPRAILVRMPNAHKELWPQQEQLYKQLDWAAIKRMVNP